MRNVPMLLVAAASAVVLVCTCAPRAEEKESTISETQARMVIAALDRDQTVLARYDACPADVFRKDMSLGALLLGDDADVTEERCARSPSECLSACMAQRSGEHCYRLALAFQDNESLVQPRYAQMMFQMACALGKASGCTNRAAHLRNASDEGDPLTRLQPAEQEKCEFRSFSAACEKDDPWGCAMLGQAYKNGEGARENLPLARRFYRKSCRLDPDFAACDFSRSALDEIARRTRMRR